MNRDYEAMTTGVGYALLQGQTLIEIRGADRAAFLHNLCTNDVRGLKPGAGCETFFTNVQGKILAFVNLLCEDEALVLETVPAQADTLLTHLDRYLIREDVQLQDRTDDWAEILVAGQQAEAALSALTGGNPPAALWSHSRHQIGNNEVTVCRVPLVEPPAWVLRCNAESSAEVQTTLQEGGGVACDMEVVEALRIENGSPLYGRDITDANLPQEVCRDETAISFVKGCYLGQETVARIDAMGHVNKLLCGVRFEGTNVPAAGMALSHDGAEVGHVISATYSPKLEAPLAIAYLRRGHETAGTRLTSEEGEGEVVELRV